MLVVAVIVVDRAASPAAAATAAATWCAAIFDNGGFMVNGEEVRVAGANVGEIESVGVTMPGEVDSYKDGKPRRSRARP